MHKSQKKLALNLPPILFPTHASVIRVFHTLPTLLLALLLTLPISCLTSTDPANSYRISSFTDRNYNRSSEPHQLNGEWQLNHEKTLFRNQRSNSAAGGDSKSETADSGQSQRQQIMADNYAKNFNLYLELNRSGLWRASMRNKEEIVESQGRWSAEEALSGRYQLLLIEENGQTNRLDAVLLPDGTLSLLREGEGFWMIMEKK